MILGFRPIDEWDRQCTHTNLRSTHNNLIQICILHTQKIQRKSRDKLQIWTSKRQVSTIYFSSTLSLHKLSFSSGVLTIECPPKSSIGMYYVDYSTVHLLEMQGWMRKIFSAPTDPYINGKLSARRFDWCIARLQQSSFRLFIARSLLSTVPLNPTQGLK